ncbi:MULTISPECIES: hypothetical protein [unclassified Rhizobium]|uniref:hypothetical protein n=1 Tax=unclassified Rhizobium TaxID=2613769 RepID=UPI0007F15F6F|nr:MULTISPECIES: hypothetical protein [unclassified Rhizobium]ANK89219.1 hypothetical protein AMK02_PE00156 [Rhizobium sp. N731]ANL19471.1 hypothetical protein AMJ97_PE00156 [Rhizobium sp. N1314]
MMRTSAAAISALLLPILASCTTTSGGIVTENKSLTAVSAERTRLGQAWHLKTDCSPSSRPNVRTVSPPAHGKLEIVPEDVLANSKKFSKCAGVKTAGMVVYYTSAAGYVGPDKTTFRESYGDGVVRDVTFDVNVVK